MAFLAIWILVLGTVDVASSLKCVEGTKFTCQQSSYLTGDCDIDFCNCWSNETCTVGECECTYGYYPTPYGCQKILKSKIDTDTSQGVDGGYMALSCSPIIDDAIYKWYKNGELIKKESKYSFEKNGITREQDSGKYACAVVLNNVESYRSNPLDLKFLNASDPKTFRKPVLTNVPKYHIADQLNMNNFFCQTNLASGKIDVKYAFYVGQEVVKHGQSWKKDWNAWPMPKSPTGKTGPLSCSYTIGSVTVKSDEVPYPDTNNLEIQVTGKNYHRIGTSPTLYCMLADTRSIYNVKDKTVSWLKDGVLLSSSDDYSFEIEKITAKDAGRYTCMLSVNGKAWSSPPFSIVTVDSKVTVTPSTAAAVSDTTFTLECDATVSPDAPFIYNWYKDWELVKGQTDKILHIQDAKKQEGSHFMCFVGWVKSPENTRIDNTFGQSDRYYLKLKS